MKGSDGTEMGRNKEGSKRKNESTEREGSCERNGTHGDRRRGEVGEGLTCSVPGALQGDDKEGLVGGAGQLGNAGDPATRPPGVLGER